MSKKPVASVCEIGDDFLEECMVGEDDDRQSRIYDFVSTPSYVICFRAIPVILYISCSWRKRVKPLRNYNIGMVMLFFLANCILMFDICRSPVHVIQAKRNNGKRVLFKVPQLSLSFCINTFLLDRLLFYSIILFVFSQYR